MMALRDKILQMTFLGLRMTLLSHLNNMRIGKIMGVMHPMLGHLCSMRLRIITGIMHQMLSLTGKFGQLNVAKNEWVEQALDDDFGSIESFDDDDYRGDLF